MSVAVDDAVLVNRTTAGDQAAFEMLLRRYTHRVYRLALNMLADHAEAEDVAQEVFATAWRQLSELDDPAAVRTWLFRIAHRRCLGVLRQRKGRRTDPSDVLPESGHGAVGVADHRASSDPHRAAESQAALRALGRALSELPYPQRAAWLLAEIDGHSYLEIAGLVGASEQAVRGRLFRARSSLAYAMRPYR